MRYVKWAAILFIMAGCATVPNSSPLPLHVHEGDGVLVKLMPGPCVDPTAKMLMMMNVPVETQPEWRHIDSTWRMQNGASQDFAGCWLEEEDSFILFFNDATGGRVDKAEFGRAKNATGV